MTDFDKLHVNNFMFKTCIPLESQYNCILIFRLFIFYIGYDGHHFVKAYSHSKTQYIWQCSNNLVDVKNNFLLLDFFYIWFIKMLSYYQIASWPIPALVFGCQNAFNLSDAACNNNMILIKYNWWGTLICKCKH